MSTVVVFLTIAKIAGVTLTGFFAMVGLLVEFKDKTTGKVTVWGRRALVGILASTLLSLSSEVLQLLKKKSDDAAAATATLAELKRHSALLTEIDRAMQPIGDIEIGYWLEVRSTQPEFTAYQARVKTAADQLATGAVNLLAVEKTMRMFPSVTSQANEILSVELLPGSPLLPDEEGEGVAYALLHRDLSVCLFHDSKPERRCAFEDRDADMWFSTRAIDEHEQRIDYDLKKNLLTVSGSRLRADPEFMRSRGTILSVPDIAGATLVFAFEQGMPMRRTGKSGKSSYVPSVDRTAAAFELPSVIFTISHREYWLRHWRFESNADGYVYFSYRLPDRVEDFSTLR